MRISDWSSDVCSSDLTFCAINLALSMAAEKDVQVLLVDADFAKPSILSTLGLSGGAGLMDALADPSIHVDDCIIRTDIPTLSVLPAGRPTNEDTEYLASARTQAVLNSLTAPHPGRIVLFDSRSEEHTSELQSLMRNSYAVL